MSATPPREPEGHATVRRSRPTPCRQPSTEAVRQGAQAASSLMLCMTSGGAGSGGKPDKSGGNSLGAVRIFGFRVMARGYKVGRTSICTSSIATVLDFSF